MYESTKIALNQRAREAAEEASNKHENGHSSIHNSTSSSTVGRISSVRQSEDDLQPGTLARHTLIAGSLAGMALTIPLTPTELLKCRAQALQGAHSTLLGAARHVIAVDGLRGLYRGFTPTFVREVSGEHRLKMLCNC